MALYCHQRLFVVMLEIAFRLTVQGLGCSFLHKIVMCNMCNVCVICNVYVCVIVGVSFTAVGGQSSPCMVQCIPHYIN